MKRRYLILVAAALLVSAGCSRGDRLRIDQRVGTEGTLPTRAIVSDFEDARPDGQRTFTGVSMIPLSPFGAYYVERHDALFPSNTQPFSVVVPRELAVRTEKLRIFESIAYFPTDQLPEAGTYDVAIRGRLNRIRATGGISRYGLSFLGDLVWNLGIPNVSRRWIVDIDYEVLNGYTGEPISPIINASFTTNRRLFNKYQSRADTTDLLRGLQIAHDTFIDGVWANLPPPSAPFWAQIREDGQRQLAEARAAQEAIVRGAPPVFSFISPANNSIVRSPNTDLRWNISAPGGLKDVIFTVNNVRQDLGINPINLSRADSAPRAIPAQDTRVPLRLGENAFDVLVTDHRGNETRASYSLTRLPAMLTPERRFALLIGAGSAAQQASVAPVATVLTDPLLGQFEASDVTTSTSARLSRADVDRLLAEFGRRPLSGDLAVIYLTTTGNWVNLAIGDESLTLQDFVNLTATSLATNQVVLFLDIDWSTGTTETLESRLDLPNGFAVFTTTNNGGPSPMGAGKSALAEAIISTFTGETSSVSRVTAERLFDELQAILATKPRGEGAASFGRYTRSHTFVNRE